ncbi:MAG: hypothetical protein ACE148_15750 [Vicinamibacterales bacterium]
MPKKDSKKKRGWERPKVTPVGTVGGLLKGGGGKLSIVQDDQGDQPRKPKGLE